MSKTIKIDFNCIQCNNQKKISLFTSITASEHLTLKDDLLDDNLNYYNCDNCNSRFKIEVPILYHDLKNQFAIWYAKDVNYVPETSNIQNYLFKAKVVNSLESLKTEILLYENNILTTEFELQKLPIKMDYSKYENIDDCLADFKHIHGLNTIECKHCNHIDKMLGFSITCENCNENINTTTDKKLYIALSLLAIFNQYLNDITIENKVTIDERINQVLSEIKFHNSSKHFESLNNYLKKIKVIGSSETLLISFNEKWELIINKDKINTLDKISKNPIDIVIIGTVSTAYINKNVLNKSKKTLSSIIKQIFKFRK